MMQEYIHLDLRSSHIPFPPAFLRDDSKPEHTDHTPSEILKRLNLLITRDFIYMHRGNH